MTILISVEEVGKEEVYSNNDYECVIESANEPVCSD